MKASVSEILRNERRMKRWTVYGSNRTGNRNKITSHYRQDTFLVKEWRHEVQRYCKIERKMKRWTVHGRDRTGNGDKTSLQLQYRQGTIISQGAGTSGLNILWNEEKIKKRTVCRSNKTGSGNEAASGGARPKTCRITSVCWMVSHYQTLQTLVTTSFRGRREDILSATC